MRELIDIKELARRWAVSARWVRERVRGRCPRPEQIPHVRLGKFPRFEWDSPELRAWFEKRRAA